MRVDEGCTSLSVHIACGNKLLLSLVRCVPVFCGLWHLKVWPLVLHLNRESLQCDGVSKDGLTFAPGRVYGELSVPRVQTPQ